MYWEYIDHPLAMFLLSVCCLKAYTFLTSINNVIFLLVVVFKPHPYGYNVQSFPWVAQIQYIKILALGVKKTITWSSWGCTTPICALVAPLIYWHSTLFFDIYYHIRKMKYCFSFVVTIRMNNESHKFSPMAICMGRKTT